jgi:hypothetical protein
MSPPMLIAGVVVVVVASRPHHINRLNHEHDGCWWWLGVTGIKVTGGSTDGVDDDVYYGQCHRITTITMQCAVVVAKSDDRGSSLQSQQALWP